MGEAEGAPRVPSGKSETQFSMSARPPVTSFRYPLELFVLCGFALAQPLLEVLGNAPETFVFRRVDGVSLVVFVLGLLFIPPMLLWAVELLVHRIGHLPAVITHDVLMGILWVLLSIQILKRAGGPPPVLALAGATAVAALAVSAAVGSRIFGMLLHYATPAPLIFALVFLLLTPVNAQLVASQPTRLTHAAIGRPSPIVMLLLDELPMATLSDRDGRIDAELFPNFAALEGQSHAFSNATSNAWWTTYSVPSLLSGRLPDRSKLPIASEYPRNLFTLLGGTYDVRAHELLSLCPDQICPDSSARGVPQGLRPLIGDSMRTLGQILDPRPQRTSADEPLFLDAIDAMRMASVGPPSVTRTASVSVPARFAEFLADLPIPEDDRPAFDFLHLMMPHSPWFTLPSGQYYTAPVGWGGIYGLHDRVWDRSGAFLPLGRQRHLFQAQYVDTLLGQMMDALRRSGAWEDALVVVTADHGVGFSPGRNYREATRATLPEIAHVPLFVKLPGQTRGEQHSESVQLVDVVPTVADALDINLPWRPDGRSALAVLDGSVRPGRFLTPSTTLRFNPRALAMRFSAVSIENFLPWTDDPLRTFMVGSQAALVGRSIDELEVGTPGRSRIALFDAGRWRGVDTAGAKLPVYVVGGLVGSSDWNQVAMTVNGTVGSVAAVGRENGERIFAGLIPPQVLQDGANDLRFFGVSPSGALTPLRFTRG
jgi:hypothetical protein